MTQAHGFDTSGTGDRLAAHTLSRYGQQMEAIRGRYRPIETVSVGGQGEVTRAMDEQHSRQVAVKTRSLTTEQSRRQALAEAQMLLAMRPHPGLPILREDFFDEDRFHLVMDWIEGTNLQDRLSATGPLSPDEALDVLARVAEAIDHLHSHEPPIVHRDIKPANVILTPDGRTVLVDLGIAVSGQGQGGGSGTRGYAAPEVASGEPVTTAADIFSFAATAFALLFGEPPRPGIEFAFTKGDEGRARLFEIGLTKGLSFDPTRRPLSAKGLLDLMRSGIGIPNNLAPTLSRFIGRETDLEEIATLLTKERLVTLTGSGGMGKTRLAEQAALAALPLFEDGVWFVGLESLSDGSHVSGSIAKAIGIRESDDADESIVESLKSSKTLLVLDNCEHLSRDVARIARLMLTSCPGLTVMTTSRTSLGLDGERVFTIGPMPSPLPSLSLHQMLSHDSVRLFIERAERADRTFRLDERNAEDVATICAALDGIPLAIELAAARCNVMTPAEIRSHLSDRFRVASAEGGRSLKSTIDWSYGLLDDAEATALRTLAVFSGGFDLPAAESVGVTFERLSALMDRSLVSTAKTPDGKRFNMLETIRTYAFEKWSPNEAEENRRAHLELFTSMAMSSEPQLAGPDQKRMLDDLDIEHDNIRAALAFAFEVGDIRGGELAAALWRFWDIHGHPREGRSWIARAMKLNIEDSVLEARLLRADGGLALSRGELDEAEALLSRSADLARRSGAVPLAAASLSALAAVQGSRGDLDREKDLHMQCLDLWRELGHDRGIAVTLGNLGTCTFDLGDYDSSAGYFEESLLIRQRIGDEHGIASSRNGLGLNFLARRDLVAAGASFIEAAEIWDQLGFRRGVAIARTNQATIELLNGNYSEARTGFEDCAAQLRDIDANRELAEALFGLAEAARMEGDAGAAIESHLGCLELRWDIGDKKGWRESVLAVNMMIRRKDPSAEATLAAAIPHWKKNGFVPSPIAWLADSVTDPESDGPVPSDETVMKMASSILVQI